MAGADFIETDYPLDLATRGIALLLSKPSLELSDEKLVQLVEEDIVADFEESTDLLLAIAV